MKRARLWIVAAAAAAAVWTGAPDSHAWLFHEHVHIGRTALSVQPPEALRTGQAPLPDVLELQNDVLTTLQAAWAEVVQEERKAVGKRAGDAPGAPRLCATLGQPESAWLFQKPDAKAADRCIDFPTLAAIAGDFSCSPEDLWNVAVTSAWLPDVLEMAQGTEKLLSEATSNEARLDAWHADHIGNFRKDVHYLDRAKDNRNHFSWPRRTDRLGIYLADALKAGRPPNAYASYIQYHAAALRFAAGAREAKAPAEHRAALRRAMLSEAFSLHYLEDSFSAGHIAGRAGTDRTRAGSHDYYCENGLEGALWQDGRDDLCAEGAPCHDQNTYLAHGDAFMTDADRLHAAHAVQRSLHDLAHALRWATPERTWLSASDLAFLEDTASPGMNSCSEGQAVPPGLADAAGDADLQYTLRIAIQPARAVDADGPGEEERVTTLPVFATEMGVFFGAFASARIVGGTDLQGASTRTELLGKMDTGFEAGLGVSGIATAQSDGLVWVQIGAALDSPAVFGDVEGRHPGRFGVAVRLHAPFYAVPLVEHLVYTIPAWFADNLAARTLLTRGAEEGLFGLARVHTHDLGSLQLVLAREFGFRYVLGPNGENNAFGFDWPVVEYKPRRWYSGSVGNTFSAQLGASLDVEDRRVSILGLFVRLSTDVRKYKYP